MLEEELVAMGITRSFFEDGGTQRGTLERIVMVPNDRTSVCLNHTVFIAKGITDRSSAFVVSLQVQNGSTTPSQTDGNQPITDLNARPVVIISGKHKVAVSVCSENAQNIMQWHSAFCLYHLVSSPCSKVYSYNVCLIQ